MARLILLLAFTALVQSAAASEATPAPSGVLLCYADGGAGEITFAFVEHDGKHSLELQGLPRGDAGYLYNATQIIFHSPTFCLVEGQAGPDGLAPLEYEKCEFGGIIDRINGRFVVFEGDPDGSGRGPVVSVSQMDGACQAVNRRF